MKTLLNSVGFLFSISLILTSCSPSNNSTAQLDEKTQARIREIERKIEALSADATKFQQSTKESIDKQVTTLGQSVADQLTVFETDIRNQVSTLRQSLYGEKSAVLDPATKGYASVNTDRGVLLFSVADASPFLDGHKIALEIGNPMNMTFSGFKLKIRYGKRPPSFPILDLSDTNSIAAYKLWIQDRQAWEKSIRNTEVSFTDELSAGAWTKIDFTLKETKPEDVTHLEVSIATDRIVLRKYPK